MPQAHSSDGVPVRYFDLGGDGPPLLMVHATGFHGLMWRPLARRLADRFHCWSVDLRGHGDSGVRQDLDFSWEGFGRDIQAVVGAIGVDRPFGFGHSLGGASLLLTEERWPGTFRALYVYEPAIFVPREDMVQEGDGSAALALRRRHRFPSADAARENFATKAPMNAFDPEVLAAYVEHGFAIEGDGSAVLKCRPTYESAVFANFALTDIYARLGEIQPPVVLARGSGGGRPDVGASDGADPLIERLRHSRSVELAGLDHFGPLEDPGALARSIWTSFETVSTGEGP